MTSPVYLVIDGNAQDVARDAESVLYYTGCEPVWTIHSELAKHFPTAGAARTVAQDMAREYREYYGPEDAGNIIAVVVEYERSEWGAFWAASEL